MEPINPVGEHEINGRRRRRITQACLNCRRKKVRCSGEKPVCNFCRRLSQKCLYAEDGRSRRQHSMVSMDPERIDDSSQSIVGTFSSRFSTLEDRLGRIEGALDQLVPALSSITSGRPSQPIHTPLLRDDTLQHIRSPSNQLSSQGSFTTQPLTPRTLSGDDLPPMNTLLFATDVYFRYCHNQPYSLFHEPTFRRRLRMGQLPVYLVWALLAAARRYSTLPDFQASPQDFQSEGKDEAIIYSTKSWDAMTLPWDGILDDEELVSILQAIVLIVYIEHPTGKCASAYMKLGYGLRAALAAKMHMNPDERMPPIQREERSRTFWSLYLQDKLISLSRERFPIVPPEECRIRLPCSEEAFLKGETEYTPTLDKFTGDCLNQEEADSCCPLAQIIVMASALSRVSQYVLHDNRYSQAGPPWSPSSPYAAISSSMLQLELHFGMNESIEESLERQCFVGGEISQHLAGSFIYARALFHLAQCLLHHPFLLQQRLEQIQQRAPLSFLRAAWDTCRTHAKSLTELKDMRGQNIIVRTSLYVYCTMVAGTIHVLAVHDRNPEISAEGSVRYKAALEFLGELSCYWRHATQMINRLERFYQQTKEKHSMVDLYAPVCERSPEDVEALWGSVDYAKMATPTRPGSPTVAANTANMENLVSPSQLFEFSDFVGWVDMAGVYDGFPGLVDTLVASDQPSPRSRLVGTQL